MLNCLSLFQFYLFVGDALSAPGVGAMKGAVATLDDGGVGELARRRIFEGKEVAPMDAVIASLLSPSFLILSSSS